MRVLNFFPHSKKDMRQRVAPSARFTASNRAPGSRNPRRHYLQRRNGRLRREMLRMWNGTACGSGSRQPPARGGFKPDTSRSPPIRNGLQTSAARAGRWMK